MNIIIIKFGTELKPTQNSYKSKLYSGDQWVFELEIDGLVGSNFWVCKSVFGFDFGGCMLISRFWLVYGYLKKKVLERQRKEKKRK